MVNTLASLGLMAANGANPELSGIAVDSRAVRKGFLFAAMPGVKVHGAAFIKTALEQGAVVILTDAKGAELAGAEIAAFDAAVVITDQPREALSRSAALWFGAQPPVMTAVTGTNGKTSVSTFVRQIWTELELPGSKGRGQRHLRIQPLNQLPCIGLWQRLQRTGSRTPRWRPQATVWINAALMALS
jgi:UDP-N-acetylmuramyl tripeptide synthase